MVRKRKFRNREVFALKRKLFSWMLAAVMIVSLLPAMAMATDDAVGGSAVVRVEDILKNGDK